MEFGIWLPAHIESHRAVSRADELGYQYAHIYDSQMVYADTFVSLALCAERTKNIKLGQGVTNGVTRIAPQMASSLGTINALAPGRAFLGIGTGYTVQTTMGRLKPQKLAEFAEYIRVVRGLIRGEVVDYTLDGQTMPIKMIEDANDPTFVNFVDEIPIYVGALGPKALALAGEVGDGLIIGGMLPTEDDMKRIRAGLKVGADKVGRKVEDIPILMMANMYVMEPGETFGNDKMKRATVGCEAGGVGCFSAGIYPLNGPGTDMGKMRNMSEDEIPETHRELVIQNRKLLADRTGRTALDGDAWYVSGYEGMGWKLRPELLPYVSDDLIRRAAFVGTGDEVLKQIRDWEKWGVTAVGPQAMDSIDLGIEMTERFAEMVIRKY